MLEAGQIGIFNRIVLKTGYTDLRCGIPTLTEILTNFYGVDFRDEGVLYLFCGTKCNKIKGLIREREGFMLLSIQLFTDRVRWIRKDDGLKEISQEQFDLIKRGKRIE